MSIADCFFLSSSGCERECWNNSAANNVIELMISSEFDETATY